MAFSLKNKALYKWHESRSDSTRDVAWSQIFSIHLLNPLPKSQLLRTLTKKPLKTLLGKKNMLEHAGSQYFLLFRQYFLCFKRQVPVWLHGKGHDWYSGGPAFESHWILWVFLWECLWAALPGWLSGEWSDSWPGGCEFDPWWRQTFSTPQKHVRKVVGVFGKKVVLVLVWES